MSNFDKLRETRLRQKPNMPFMFVTFNVVAPDILMDVIASQPLNMPSITVTFDVLNLDTSSAVSLLQQ